MISKRFCALLLCLLCVCAAAQAEKKAIYPEGFPKDRPFSPAILANGTVYVSGQVGRNPKTGTAPADFEAEVKQCLDNIGVILKAAGVGFEDVVAVQVYLTDIGLFSRMNQVYMTYFKEPRPARTTVGIAGLAGDFRIEITVTAVKP